MNGDVCERGCDVVCPLDNEVDECDCCVVSSRDKEVCENCCSVVAVVACLLDEEVEA